MRTLAVLFFSLFILIDLNSIDSRPLSNAKLHNEKSANFGLVVRVTSSVCVCKTDRGNSQCGYEKKSVFSKSPVLY